ncbi:MAG: FG-GAP repeat protein, partial [Rhodothermaceae bacterium]|nr:FG-GAP repeat protein [Rhodothermaceae bacterium]
MKPLSTFFCVLLIFCFFPVTALAQSIQSATTGLGFGASAATNGDDIFVGAAAIGWPRGDEPAGTVYHYTKNEEGAWVDSGRIQASDARIGDFFGRSIYLKDSMLLIGAPGVARVYIYEKNEEGEWIETGSVKPSNVGGKIDFGGTYARGGYRTNTIAMAGDRIVVSAYPRVDLDLRSGRYAINESGGAVYIFKKEEGEWIQESVLTSDETEGNGFGFSLVASESHIVVSAPGTENGKGALHAYMLHEGTWKHSVIDSGSELNSGSIYGLGLAMHSNNLYVSAPGFERTGTVFSFSWSEEAMGWEPSYRLTLPVVAANNRRGGLGTDLAISDRALLINGPNNSVYAYQKTADAPAWASMHVLTAPNERSQRAFGIGLAVSDDVAVIGSPNADYQEGLATVFENDGQMGAWKPTGMLISETNRLTSVTGD